MADRDERDDRPDQAAAERIAESIERDVDDRLGRALFPGGQRRVEELVAGAEPRASKDRFAAARHEEAAEPRRHEAAEAPGEQRDRRAARRESEAESLEHRRGCQTSGARTR